ncbi:ribonucleotide reductase inhibitor [Diplodia corticola]|uniref:Ribonucleotide reductase inhibitor n=1 Tax=Diplodia corticola TaxID=236234 RepID=A0A1J9S4N1_9PEZI|nr:ribonucleotide reductase inhibitor [Diplodia corticola]OJD34589.1 ribonucleotide reductase inhibitor [Diplodia corticola]
MSTTSAHRTKRPFQPSITSYFARADRSDPDAASSPICDQPPPQGLAAVPANVQASLLNVGMRVRKSVPEGYKTHKTLPPTANPSIPSHVQYKPQATFAPTMPTSRPTELLPFCGIHKTGGYDVQQQSPSYFHHDAGNASSAHAVDAHAFASPADDFGLSSQESNASTISTDSLPTNKRRYEDDEDGIGEHDLAADNARGDNGDGARPLFPSLNTGLAVPARGDDVDELQISPRTVYPVSHTVMPNLGAPMRPVARPRTRRKNGDVAGARGGGRRQAVDEDPLDFGEADFLRPPSSESWGGDVEVEMGGI